LFVPLHKVFANDFDIGAAVNPITIEAQKQLLVAHVNGMTAENHMKFEHLQPKEGELAFEQADQIVEFAYSHQMMARGHTLYGTIKLQIGCFRTVKAVLLVGMRCLSG
jgi:endo-1,4-beta-xylanase